MSYKISPNGVTAWQLNPMKWQLGIEHTWGDDGGWRWLMLGPLAVNLGHV